MYQMIKVLQNKLLEMQTLTLEEGISSGNTSQILHFLLLCSSDIQHVNRAAADTSAMNKYNQHQPAHRVPETY